MKYKVIIRGLVKKYFLWLYNVLKKKGTGGTNSALYCYSVWLRHLVLLYENGMNKHPKTIAELGPGDSLGIGLNALLTGATTFYAFDIIKHANIEKNIQVFDELVNLYKSKTNIPDRDSFEKVKPKLINYEFPNQVLNDEYLKKMLAPARINHIRDAIKKGISQEFLIKYIVPWDDSFILEKERVDLIYSQAVMEHVLDIDRVYDVLYKWLRKGGFMSHEIDYSAHETHKMWYGHWKYPNWLWKIILKGRLYSINRYPNSYHIKILSKNNFQIVFQLPFKNSKAKFIDANLSKKYEFTDEDLDTSSCFIIARK